MSEGLASGYGEESVGGGTTKPDATSICCGPRDAAGSRSGVGILEERKLRVGVKMRLWAKPAGFCPPRGPPAPSRGRQPGRPHLGKLSGGRAMTRGREVSTTSPRLASTRMFWMMFSSSASCRLAKDGSLRGARASAPPPATLSVLRGPPLCCAASRVLCVDSHLTPHPPNVTRLLCSNFTDTQTVA